jgi:hypothetical protein
MLVVVVLTLRYLLEQERADRRMRLVREARRRAERRHAENARFLAWQAGGLDVIGQRMAQRGKRVRNG